MSIETIKEILTFIVLIGSTLTVMYTWLVKPMKTFITEQKHCNKLQNRCIADLLEHVITGNHVETLDQDLTMLKDEVYK